MLFRSVCIPIIQSTNTTPATNLLTEIINSASLNAPTNQDMVVLNIPNFTLNTLLPTSKTPFYSYVGGSVYDTTTQSPYIIFGSEYGIPLNTDIIQTLQSIISPYEINLSSGSDGNLFYNDKGANSNVSNNNGIYISCQPTGESDEEVTTTTSTSTHKNTTTYNFGSLFQNSATNQAMKIILGILLVVGVLYFVKYLYQAFILGAYKPLMSISGANISASIKKGGGVALKKVRFRI